MNRSFLHQTIGLAAGLALGGFGHAGTLTDSFDVAQDYLAAGVVGTVWDGVYLGAGEFTNLAIGGGPGQTLQCDVQTTNPGRLTVRTTQTDWEFDTDDGFFLYKVVPGDFQAVVRIATPYDNVAYNTAGLMARAFTGAGEPFNGAENHVTWTRFDEYGFANYGRSTLDNTTTQVNPGDPEGADLYWLMLERIGDTFFCYQKAAEGDDWIMVSNCIFDRPDFYDLPVQVGIMQATFSANSPIVQFETFSLTNDTLGAASPAAATGLAAADAGSGSLDLAWTPGSGTAGSVVIMRPGAPITRQPIDGIAYNGNAVFGSGDTLGSGNVVVYAGTGSSVTVSGLTASVSYHIAVYSYAGSGANLRYGRVNPPAITRVAPGDLAAIAVSFANANVAADDTAQAVVTATFEGGGTLNVSASATYETSDPAVATVAAGGVVSGLSAGTATITARYQGLSDGEPITIVKVPVTDDFSGARDYLVEGIVGTPWQGLLLGADDMPSTGAIGGNPGRTLAADAGFTKAGRLSIRSTATDWENTADDGFFLYRMVAGDFKVSIQRPAFEPIAYNWPGLMARVPFDLLGSENYVALTGFDQYGIGNYVRSVVNAATANGPFTAVPAKPFTMLERRGNTFFFYEKAHALDEWTLITSVERIDMDGLALEVGIAQACFSDNSPWSEFDNFNIEIATPPTGQPDPAANLILTRSGVGAIQAQWTPGTGSAGSVVIAHAVTGLTRQPVNGIAYSPGIDIGGGNLVVHAGAGSSATLAGLSAVLYHVAVYSYTEVDGLTVYNLNAPAASLEALGPPAITADPVSKSLYAGRTAHFSSGAMGTSPLGFQWRKGAVNLVDGDGVSGAATSALTIANLDVSDSGSYSVVVSNEAGSVTSNPATLTVVTPSGKGFEAAVLSCDPVAYWRLGEPDVLTPTFDFWNGYDGTCGELDTPGQPGPAPADGFAIFESDNKAVGFPSNAGASPVTVPALNLNGNTVTFLCWIKPAYMPNSDRAGLFMCAGTTGSGMRFSTGGGALGFLWNGGMVGTSTLVPKANEWSFAALTVAPTEAVLYLGDKAGLQSWSQAGDYPVVPFDTVSWIGSDRLVADRYFDGLIDEVAVFDVALTPAQIANVFAGIENPPTPPTLSVVRDGTQIVLAWPVEFTGFTLTSTPTLGSGASWAAVPTTPVQEGGFNKVAVPATASAAFYRLVRSGN